MARMNPPHSSAVVDVRESDVDRYREQGWTEVKSEPKQRTGRKASSEKK